MKFSLQLKQSTKVGFLALASTVLLATGLASAAQAQYPERTVSMVIPFPPGGPTDIAARVLADAFGKELGETFIAENKSGASGTIGVRFTMRAKPDGYTIGMLAAPSLTAPFILSTNPYDLSKDIQPVGIAYETPLILVVNPNVYPDVTDIKSLVDTIKKGDQLTYTTSGIGSTAHLTIEILKSELGIETLHVPYQGSGPAVAAALSGEVPVFYSDAVAVLPQVRAGKLRAIALNSPLDNEAVAGVKTLEEQGVESAKALSWGGIFAPKGTPKETVDVLSKTLEKVLKDPVVAERMQNVGAYPAFSTPEQMQEIINRDSAIWKKAIDDNNLKQQ